MVRGADHDYSAQGSDQVRSAQRHYGISTHTDGNMGFRVAIEIAAAKGK